MYLGLVILGASNLLFNVSINLAKDEKFFILPLAKVLVKGVAEITWSGNMGFGLTGICCCCCPIVILNKSRANSGLTI